jgi:hypothetical protein
MKRKSRFDAINDPAADHQQQDSSQPASRPFLGINFECCRVYGRVYRNDEQTAYTGHCPKCGAKINVPIGGGGTSQRFFNAN